MPERKPDILPYEPQTLEEAQGRLPAALEKCHTLADLEAAAGRPGGPLGLHRKFVFDFHSGLRLVVSREDHGDGPLIHASASPSPELVETMAQLAHLTGPRRVRAGFVDAAKKQIERLLGKADVGACEFSEAGYPHWFIPEEVPK